MNRRSRPTPRAGLTPKAGTCSVVMVGGWGEEMRNTKGSKGTVRSPSYPNCKPNSTILMSGMGLGQNGEIQKSFLWTLLEGQKWTEWTEKE